MIKTENIKYWMIKIFYNKTFMYKGKSLMLLHKRTAKYFYKEHEKETKELLENFSGTMIDVGSHIGWFPLQLHDKFERIICFEPNHNNFAILKENIKANKYEHIKCEEYALSNINKTEKMSDQNSESKIGKGKLTIQCKTLDSFKIKNPCIIKIDVEGHEYEVIQGAEKTIKKYKPALLIEKPSIKTIRLLEELGYKLSRYSNINKLYTHKQTKEGKKW